MREEVFKALKSIDEKYIQFNGPATEFLSFADLDDLDITDGGFELNPRGEHICLYVDEGTLYIREDGLTYFKRHGDQKATTREDLTFIDLTEEWHFQMSTKNELAAVFEYQDFAVLSEYVSKFIGEPV